MASFGSGFGSSSFRPASRPASPRPPTGGPLTQGSPAASASLFGGAPVGAGFGVGTPGVSSLFPPGAFGGGHGQIGFLQSLGGRSAPPTGPRIPQGQRPGGQFTGFDPRLGQGNAGFTASPRLLTRNEIGALNQQLGIAGTPEAFKANPFRARQQLGPLGFIADPTTFSRSQIPFIETRLNFENLLQAQADRQAALDLLSQQRDVIGQTPDQQLALDVARRRLEQPEPFTPEELAFQTGEIRSRAGRGLEASQRAMAEDIARQGLAGTASSFQQARLQQEADRQASEELQRLAIENALQRDINEAAAIDRLQGITSENELRQIALNQALTELLTATRGEFDLSALAGKERKAERGVLSKIGFF